MNQASFAMKTTLIAAILLSSKTYAQSLPDEINHPVYLTNFQNLEQIVAVKSAEFKKLSAEKNELETSIGQMEHDLVALPQRSDELQVLIKQKKEELARIEYDIKGLEAVIEQILSNLQQIDSTLNQLKNELQSETSRNQSIANARREISAQIARINEALNAEVAEENQSLKRLEVLSLEINNNVAKRNDANSDRQQLVREFELARRDLPVQKKRLNENQTITSTKKAQLSEAQSKVEPLKEQIAKEDGKVVAFDADIAPKNVKLKELKAELALLTPEIAKLEKENKDLQGKITANNGKISATGLTGFIAKKTTLDKEISALNEQIKALSESIVAAKESIKPDVAESIELRQKIRQLERTNGSQAEIQRLTNQFDAVEKRLAPKRAEITRQEKLLEKSSFDLIPKKSELETVAAKIETLAPQVEALNADNAELSQKITENQKKIDSIMAQNAPLVKEIKDLEAVVAALQTKRDSSAKNLAELKTRQVDLNGQIVSLGKEISLIENNNLLIAKEIAQMEQKIADFALDNRRLENLIKKLEENISSKQIEISREEKLLARIRQDRLTIERDLAAAQTEFNRINTDLSQSDRLLISVNQQIQTEKLNRETLTRRNQDSVSRYDKLVESKLAAEKVVTDANQEIAFNEQDLVTINQELPNLKRNLISLNSKVSFAEKSLKEAQGKAQSGKSQYEERLSLYERYLTEARNLGSEKALIATSDGEKAGAIEGQLKATKLASENAANHAKWQALHRGYVRGEISGYSAGYESGLASTADANRGDSEGAAAGAKRAKDHANMVLKPEFYLEELERRLVEVEVPQLGSRKAKMSDMESMAFAKLHVFQLNDSLSDVPELSQAEINQSLSIPSSLDALIAQAIIESSEILKMRNRLIDHRQAYVTPSAGENSQNPNCAGVYKNVKDFVEACKGSYLVRYPTLYSKAHIDSFAKVYSKVFGEQINAVFNTELSRLYPTYLKEGTNIGRNVGLDAGKQEIYRQAFSRAEITAFNSNLPKEEDRVSNEAFALVDEHLSTNAALTLKGMPTLVSSEDLIAPGSDLELKMLLKNIGAKASTGNSLLKITQASSNLIMATRQAAVGQVAPLSETELSVMSVKVNDNASPGAQIFLAGEIVHPGNHYRASRVETFKVEAILKVNPAIESEVVYTRAPNIATLGILKKHKIDFSMRPKHEGVDQGYEVSIEEVGSSLVKFSNSRENTERLNRGVSKKLTFKYKLDKSAKGKTITLRITVKNDGRTVKTNEYQIAPK